VPYAREPQDCANDPTVRQVVLMWASQTTKSTCLENVNGYFIAADPSPILMVQPTVEMAQAWSKERFVPTVRDTPCLRDILANDRSRDSGNTIQLKTFPGGNLAIIGANAPAGLAGRPRRVVLLDEVDRYPASAGTEGDPVLLAIRRTESFWNSVIYMTSTPTIKGASRIESEYEQTDKRMWFVPCPKCGIYQTLKWANVRWDNAEPESAYYECETCRTRLEDSQRVAAIHQGEWRPTALFTGKRGYFLNGIYSPFRAKRGFKSRLHQMAAEFLEAKHGGTEQLKTWTNTFLAETWEDASEKIEPGWLSQRVEPYTSQTIPDSVAVIIAGADVQKDRIEVEFIGMGMEEESWGIEVCKVYGDTEDLKTWLELSRCIDRTFKRVDGTELRCVAIGIDIHFRPRATKEWINNHGTRCRVYGVFGIGAAQPTLVQLRPNGCFSIATDYTKDIIYARFKIAEPGPRYMHFPNGGGYTDDWFRQLTCERVVTKYNKGFAKRIYEKTSGVRNEALDMRVYGMATLDILRPDIAAIQASLKPKEKPKAGGHPLAMQPQRPGWVTGWR
jgi:phage terminase large subunit GpA-like protein